MNEQEKIEQNTETDTQASTAAQDRNEREELTELSSRIRTRLVAGDFEDALF